MYLNLLTDLVNQKVALHLTTGAKLEGTLLSVSQDCIILSGRYQDDSNNLIPLSAIVCINTL